jgi:predicted nucleotidyltransferase
LHSCVDVETTNETVIEGYYLETVEGLFFAVKGHIHPPQRTIAYLRYLPHEAGERERDGRRYRRVYHFPEQEEVLLRQYPHYRFYDPIYGRELQGVPISHRRHVYSPRRGLADLRLRRANRPIEDALFLASLLHEQAGVDWSCLGISGSLLIGLGTPASDIDLLVYGAKNGRAVQQVLRELFTTRGGEVKPLSEEEGMRRLYRSRLPDTQIGWSDFLRHEQRKINQGTCRGREYFIRFVKEEVRERYGERRYQMLGRARIRAQVLDDSDALFTPCIYKVEQVTGEDPYLSSAVREIISFRGRFSEQAQAGEWIIAQGFLERVTEQKGQEYLRLVLGEHPDDYLIVRSNEL